MKRLTPEELVAKAERHDVPIEFATKQNRAYLVVNGQEFYADLPPVEEAAS